MVYFLWPVRTLITSHGLTTSLFTFGLCKSKSVLLPLGFPASLISCPVLTVFTCVRFLLYYKSCGNPQTQWRTLRDAFRLKKESYQALVCGTPVIADRYKQAKCAAAQVVLGAKTGVWEESISFPFFFLSSSSKIPSIQLTCLNYRKQGPKILRSTHPSLKLVFKTPQVVSPF